MSRRKRRLTAGEPFFALDSRKEWSSDRERLEWHKRLISNPFGLQMVPHCITTSPLKGDNFGHRVQFQNIARLSQNHRALDIEKCAVWGSCSDYLQKTKINSDAPEHMLARSSLGARSFDWCSYSGFDIEQMLEARSCSGLMLGSTRRALGMEKV